MPNIRFTTVDNKIYIEYCGWAEFGRNIYVLK